MKNLVWLASYPKSGNTWLRLFLANYLSGSEKPVPIDHVERYSTGDSLATLYKAAAGGPFDPHDDHKALQLREAVFRSLSLNGADVNLVKTHNKNRRVERVRLIPHRLTRHAFYVIRDPLDMLASYSDHYGVDPAQAAREIGDENNSTLPGGTIVRQFLGSWSEHVTSWTHNPKFPLTVLRYEDMHSDPEATFSKMLRDLGAPTDSARLRHAISASSFAEVSQQESASGFIEKSPLSKRFFRSGKTGVGRAGLDADVTAKVINDHGDVMQRFGYEI